MPRKLWLGRLLGATWAVVGGCSDAQAPAGTAPDVALLAAKGPAGATLGAGDGQKKLQDGGADAQVTTFSYSPVGRRDPFRSYLTQVRERQVAHVQDHRHENTEDFDVAQFRLVGLVTGTSQPKAMVDDPNGEAHVVHIGSRIGKNGGRVHSISATGLTVLEEYVDASGKAVTLPIEVRLPQDRIDGPSPQQ